MISVTFNGNAYECAKAVKGSDYIYLFNEDDVMIASFLGITDFGLFEITGGQWTIPSDEGECYVLVMGEDGVLRKSSMKCGAIASATHNHDGVYYKRTDTVANATNATTAKDYNTSSGNIKTKFDNIEERLTNLGFKQGTVLQTYTTEQSLVKQGNYCILNVSFEFPKALEFTEGNVYATNIVPGAIGGWGACIPQDFRPKQNIQFWALGNPDGLGLIACKYELKTTGQLCLLGFTSSERTDFHSFWGAVIKNIGYECA